MDLNAYQKQAATSAIYPGRGSNMGLAYTVLGLAGEAGEIANKVKKIIRDDGSVANPIRREEIIAELGDVLWYVAMIATELEANLSGIGTDNLLKLANRKKKGTLRGSGDNR
jgi:NTP pyrophosphatase (non-canonical NTP hydrolase)